MKANYPAGVPFWTQEDSVPRRYPWLSSNQQTQLLIIGGGITAAFSAYRFSKAGIKTTVVSHSPIGFGGVATNSGSLAYDNGLSMHTLRRAVGKDTAVSFCSLLSTALQEAEDICGTLPPEVNFRRRNSLWFTNEKTDADDLHAEFLLRRHNGFSVRYLERADLRDEYSFPVEAGLLSKALAAEVDPYFLCHALFHEAENNGCTIFENTMITDLDVRGDHVIATSGLSRTITAEHVLIATGHDQNQYLRVPGGKRYAVTCVTEPLAQLPGYESRDLLIDISTGVRLRTTADNRVMITAESGVLSGNGGKLMDKLGAHKLTEFRYQQLHERLKEMFCGMEKPKLAYRYTSSYLLTADCLPVIGEHPAWPQVYFAMPSGSDTVLTAVLASRLLLSAYQGETSPSLEMFSPTRRTLSRRLPFSEDHKQ